MYIDPHTFVHVCSVHEHVCPMYCMCCRPEADDVRAMQQQLSSLHLVMEQSTTEHEKQLAHVTSDRDREKEERGR